MSFSYIFFLILIAFFAYQIAPDSTSNANQMHLSIHSKPPGFKSKMVLLTGQNLSNQSTTFFYGDIDSSVEIPIQNYKIINEGIEIQPYGMPKDYYEVLSKDRLPQPFEVPKFIQENIVEKTFYLGTDKYGRDLLSRLIIGTRISLSIGFVAVFISLFIGVFLGAIAGYFGGYVDKVIVWLINVVWSIPTLLMVIAITLALGRGFWQVFYCSRSYDVGGSCSSR